MPTRSGVLTKHQEELIEALVQSGRFDSATEVVREGLRLVELREVDETTKLEALRAAVAKGIAAVERGEFKEFSDGASLAAYLLKRSEDPTSDSSS